MTDYKTIWNMLRRGIKRMEKDSMHKGFIPKLKKEQGDGGKILILDDSGVETWYYFDNKERLDCVRGYSD
jgi:hypothetical protein